MKFEPPIRVLRVFSEPRARAFYLEWLGFTLDWESRFADDAPWYAQVSRGPVVLHLSEHFGDCSPGAKVLVNVDDVEAFHAELSSRPNPNMRPGVELSPWNAKVMDVIDPFSNRISFNQRQGP